MMMAMIAHFTSTEARDLAYKAAVEEKKEVRLVGDAALVARGSSSETKTPFILFFGEMMDGIFFMQKGASFCGPIY